MAVVEQRITSANNAIRRILPNLPLKDDKTYHDYYKYSKWKDSKATARTTLHGVPVFSENSWRDIPRTTQARPRDVVEYYYRSQVPIVELQPEEEFLRNYLLDERDAGPLLAFLRHRSQEEMAVYGDMALRHWYALVQQLSDDYGHAPLGLACMERFIDDHGDPFHQSTRDLSKISDERYSSSVVLFFEMSICEALHEFNVVLRSRESGIPLTTRFGRQEVDRIAIVRELYTLMLTHPKKVCNMLRASYSWFVKNWGIAAPEVNLLESSGSDDRNSKDITFHRWRRVRNPYSAIVLATEFHKSSLRANLDKVDEATAYASKLAGTPMELRVFRTMMANTYTTEFDPRDQSHLQLASLLLAIQTMAGYGRAWIVNAGDDPERMLRPSRDNHVTRVARETEKFFVKAYEEARMHGHDIIPPEDMYSSLLRLAKNTSSGFSTEVEVKKKYGPRAERRDEVVRIKSRQKALYLMREGHKIYSPDMMNMSYTTPTCYQTRGTRDVPIKATRTIYAINVNVLAPQHILTLPLNEYFARAGGSTHPASSEIGGKIIIGDLEATGSRVMDAADTFRNTSDTGVWTLALDYSNYDTHMTQDNFRRGMISGIRQAVARHHSLRYEGWSVDQLIEAGYGAGRVAGTLWNGKRRVCRMDRADYERLPLEDREVPPDAPFRFRPPGTSPIRSLALVKEARTSDFVLVTPWDGSDLARVSTHLSGENSTLVANSLHNMAMGRVIQDEVQTRHPGTFEVLSEMYVGDDTLHYVKLLTLDSARIDRAINTIFQTIELCGHEASAAKTTFAPFSAEKTQTHAKQGVYIPQDRMMVISSERRKEIEDVQGYMRAQATTFVTKVSRGFSEDLAHRILLLKASLVGYRRFKATIFDGTKFRRRKFFSEEDGYTLCRLLNPAVLYAPVECNGYGVHPFALNVVQTCETHLDSIQLFPTYADLVSRNVIRTAFPPPWNETDVDSRLLSTQTPMGLYSRIVRPTVRMALTDPDIAALVTQIPLGEHAPDRLSSTMMHSALLKESRARALLAPAYEDRFIESMNKWRPHDLFKPTAGTELTAAYAKVLDLQISARDAPTPLFPDMNLSPAFLAQKQCVGHRTTVRPSRTYMDHIDRILRGDVVMRGIITANTIMTLLEKIGFDHDPADLAIIFELLNLDKRVARRLAEFVTGDRLRFDVHALNKRGIGGDEFTMSLDVCTDGSRDQRITFPPEFTLAERDAAALHAEQIQLLFAAHQGRSVRVALQVRPEHRSALRKARIKMRTPRLRVIRSAARAIRSASLALAEGQFL
uniref:RNA-directed RNA polymerase n=1 Tax=Kemerovo virus TaxID=40064 RepID=A0A5S9EDL6_9REOV|nr:RNA-dependent RNA polymerase [Kemerovo virus]